MRNNILKRVELYCKDNYIKTIYIFGHVRHDADAKGSALALVEYFTTKGFESKYIFTGNDFCFIEVFGKVKRAKASNLSKNFAAIIVDTKSPDMMENNLYKNARKIFKIDHHVCNESFGDEELIDTSVSSCCEIIANLIGDELTPTIATYLYTGMLTDSCGMLQRMSANSYKTVAKLIENGAENVKVNELFKIRNNSLTKARINGLILYKQKYFDANRNIVGSLISNDKFDANSMAKGVNALACMESKVYFVSATSNNIDYVVELRSRDDSNINVAQIAKKYGGSGHFHASRFTTDNVKDIYHMIDDLKSLS